MADPDSKGHGKVRAAWRQIRTLYFYELRGALRERAIVVNSILIPIFLYPVIIWAGFTGLMFVQGQSDKFISRIEVRNLPESHPGLRKEMERDKQIQIVHENGSATNSIQSGKLDALVEFLPADDAAAKLPDNFQVRITFNGSKDRSEKARGRIIQLVEDYREDWIDQAAKERGISPKEWKGVSVVMRNVASERQMGGLMLGLVLPILFVVMVAVGCFYPAVDATAGERERNTWETLISSAAGRVNIVTAKYLYVTTMGGLAGALNVTAVTLTLKPIFGPLFADAGITINFSVPLAAIPIMVLSALLLAGFVAAGMMIFASFARTFKEGQAMIMPFYLLVMIPPMFLQSPGLQFTLPLALVPIVNVTMMVRSAVAGIFPWAPIGITVLVSLGLIALCIRLAAFVLQFEDVMTGTYSGGVKRFISERVLRRKAAANVLKGNP